jgi:hypothetical protein
MFRTPGVGGETELLLDRAGNVRARWTANGPRGLASPATLIADAKLVAHIAATPPGHAGHAH